MPPALALSVLLAKRALRSLEKPLMVVFALCAWCCLGVSARFGVPKQEAFKLEAWVCGVEWGEMVAERTGCEPLGRHGDVERGECDRARGACVVWRGWGDLRRAEGEEAASPQRSPCRCHAPPQPPSQPHAICHWFYPATPSPAPAPTP